MMRAVRWEWRGVMERGHELLHRVGGGTRHADLVVEGHVRTLPRPAFVLWDAIVRANSPNVENRSLTPTWVLKGSPSANWCV